MSNKFGIPEDVLNMIRTRDSECVYCHKTMINPYASANHKDSATIEHFREEGPFYWDKGLKAEDLAVCCGSCNSSRGKKKLKDWFQTKHCLDNKINEELVAEPVRKFLELSLG